MKILKILGITIFTFCQSFNAEVFIQAVPPIVNTSKSFSVKVNSKPLGLFAIPSRYGNNISYGTFGFTDSVTIEVTTNFPSSGFTKWKFLPATDSIKYKILSNGIITFKLYKPTKLTLILNGDYRGRTLHLVASGPQINPPDTNSPGTLFFGPGLHEISAEEQNTITLESNRKVYLSPGAIVKGYIRAENAENIKVYGQGILLPPSDSINKHAIDFEACSNISVSGISILMPHEGDGIFIYKSDQSNISNATIINPVIWNSEGIVVANSSETTIKNCLIRSGSNAIAIKGIGNNREVSNDSIEPGSALPNTAIDISQCRLWSDNSNAIGIGPETMTEYISDVTISDCDILFVRDEEIDKAAISVFSLQSTDIYNVSMKDINIYTSGQLIVLKNSEQLAGLKGSQKWPGNIHDITFYNIKTFERGNDRIQIEGWDSTKLIHNIALTGIITMGDTVNANSPLLNLNDFTSAITINGDTIKKPVQTEPVTSTHN
ncbi:hypothetical protein ACE1ET_12740 [Saccharicrinis sp. FJH62]|uniref:hypothetical protein n=1 Tax=Saccharicrinis sp. FJH62 TaxID=3344657 RepID=UPI0035D4E779